MHALRFGVLVTCLIPAVAPPAWGCALGGVSEAVVLASIEPRLELRLADGRLIRLAGLDPAGSTPTMPDRADVARTDLTALVASHSLRLALLADRTDRWGRWPAAVSLDDGRDLAGVAIEAGLGRYRAEEAAKPCRAALLAAESAARDGKRGLWADPFYAIVAPDDLAAMTERSATIVVAEGRLDGVETTPYRTRLRLAPLTSSAKPFRRHERDRLVGMITPRTMKRFAASGFDLGAATGSTVRLRGLLDLRFGPEIDLTDPDAVEIVTQRAQTATKDAAAVPLVRSGRTPNPIE